MGSSFEDLEVWFIEKTVNCEPTTVNRYVYRNKMEITGNE